MRSVNVLSWSVADRPLFYAYLALLLWLPLPLGSNRVWAWSLMEVWILALAVIWLLQYLRGKADINRPFVRAWPVTACLLVTTVWVIVQTLPLPAGVLGLLSPQALDIHGTTQSYPSLSLDVYATRQSTLKTLCYLLLFCLTLLLINDKQRIKRLAQVIVLGGVFQASYGALMTLSGLEYGFFVEKESGVGVATGTFINRNHLAGYMEMCLAVGTGLLLAELSTRAATDWRDRARRLLATLLGSKARIRIALVVMVIGLVMTHSRMGNTAFFVSLTSVGAFYLFVIRRVTRGGMIFFVSLLLIDLLVVGNFFGVEKVAERLQETSLESESRDEVSRDTLAIVRDFPLTGTGAGSFYSTYPMYNSGEVAPAFYRHAHNDYLQFASEFGLPALAVLAFSVLASFWAAVSAQIARRDRLLQGMGFATTMGIVALLIHSAVDFNLQIPANAAMFVVLMALAWISRYSDSRTGSKEP
ncbi:MAG: O-antigen ligase family protein [Gammaproteobacteria bacterium]|nr:O-antigen ligase family protein [Gammaproteobacteria bacterium]